MADTIRVKGVETDDEAHNCDGDSDSIRGPEVMSVVCVKVDLADVGDVCGVSGVRPCI
jgi:hypothetical protein